MVWNRGACGNLPHCGLYVLTVAAGRFAFGQAYIRGTWHMAEDVNVEGAILIGRSVDGKKGTPEVLTLKLANRHGLITGATGTGKTVTLQVLAEGFSRRRRAGVHGRREGRPLRASPRRATPSDEAREARRGARLDDYEPDGIPGRSSGTCSASRATRSAPPSPRWGRCCWRACSTSTTRRRACSTSPSSSPTTTACCCSTSRTCARCCSYVADNARGAHDRATATSRTPVDRRDPARAAACSSSRAASSSSASRRSTSPT